MRDLDRRVLEATDRKLPRSAEDIASVALARHEIVAFALRRLAKQGLVEEGTTSGRWLRTPAGDEALNTTYTPQEEER